MVHCTQYYRFVLEIVQFWPQIEWIWIVSWITQETLHGMTWNCNHAILYTITINGTNPKAIEWLCGAGGGEDLGHVTPTKSALIGLKIWGCASNNIGILCVKYQSHWQCGSALTGGGTLVQFKKPMEIQIFEQSIWIFEHHHTYMGFTYVHNYSLIQCVGGPRGWALIWVFSPLKLGPYSSQNPDVVRIVSIIYDNDSCQISRL